MKRGAAKTLKVLQSVGIVMEVAGLGMAIYDLVASEVGSSSVLTFLSRLG